MDAVIAGFLMLLPAVVSVRVLVGAPPLLGACVYSYLHEQWPLGRAAINRPSPGVSRRSGYDHRRGDRREYRHPVVTA